jgi:hypothetical protein
MKLHNFDISSSIELQSGSLFWDLHNFANFQGLELVPTQNAVVMSWTVPEGSNPWGCYENNFGGMKLRFVGLQFMHVTPRNKNLPLSEDTCVSDILRVDPRIEHADPHMRAVLEMTDLFRLAICLQSGRIIEIESDKVELIPVSGHALQEREP